MPDVGAFVDRVKRLPVIRVVVGVQQRYGQDHAGLLASAIAYHAFFSLFPLMLVAFSILGFVLEDPQRQREVIESLTDAVPGLQPLIGDSVEALVDARAATGAIGVLGFLWTGSMVVRASGSAMVQTFRIDVEGDNPLKQNLWVFGSLGALALLAAVSVGVSFLGSNLPGGNAGAGVLLIGLGVVVDFGMFLVAYRVLTRGGGPSFRAMFPGAIVATVGWTILKLVGSWYARRTVANATAVYGTFAGAVGILVMLSFGARFFLYGAVVNAIRIRENPRFKTDVMHLRPGEEIPRPRSDDGGGDDDGDESSADGRQRLRAKVDDAVGADDRRRHGHADP